MALQLLFTRYFCKYMYILKKSLGQHFLKDDHICIKIVHALKQNPIDQLLEVGPGGGALTKHLLAIENINLKAVEVDDDKIKYLLQNFPQLEQKLIHQSFLDMSLPFEGNFTVVGNFPYNISSQILFKVLEWKDQVPIVIGMFQKEVAQRVAAKPGNKTYGILSVLVQAFYEVKYLFDVAPGCFNPPPKVMSGVIQLSKKSAFPVFKSEKYFFTLVKLAFNQRRKTLRNATRGLFDPMVLEDEIFNKRAEQLSVDDFAQLTFKMR